MIKDALLRRKLANALTAGARLCAVTALLAFSSGLPAHAAASACQPMLDAILKQVATPTHMYMTETAAFRGGKPFTSESIQAGGAIYVQIKGVWHRSPMTMADMQKQQAENAEEAKKGAACRYLRDEPVNGEPAAVYSEHSVIEGAISDATAWISKSRGLPLRLESDINAGGKMGKTHRSIRYEYGDVRPPAGVK